VGETRGVAVAIGLLKRASAVESGARLGRGLKKVVLGSGDVGAGIARGLGTSETAGRLVGYGTLAGGTYIGGQRAKRKIDELKFRLQYGNSGVYY
jgi:hypothetical protein